MTTTRYHYWIVAVEPESSKPYLLYGGTTEEEARQKGLEILGGLDFEIKRLPTRNQARASSLLKGGRLEQTHSLKRASKRLGHDRSLRQMQRREAKKKQNRRGQ